MARHKVGIKQRQPGMGSHPLMRYDQADATMVVGSVAVSADKYATLFDNSALAGGKYVKVGKLTMQWFMDFNEANVLYVTVYKDKESSAAQALDDEATIRDMRSEGRLIRGPWQVSPH